VIARLRARGWTVGGFLQEPLGDPGEPEGYVLVDLRSGERVPLARSSSTPEVCNWSFEPQAFARAAEWCAAPELDFVFLQLGPLEAGGEGHWPTVTRTLAEAHAVAVLGMRPNVLARLALRLPDPIAGLELPVDDPGLERFVDRIAPARDAR